MNNLSDVFIQLQTILHKGKSTTTRTYEKSFGLFKNPVFLITFFTIVIGTLVYYLYHYFKKQSDSECFNFTSEKDCPDNCLWDEQNKECESVDRKGNVCPDYFKVKKTGDAISCIDEKSVITSADADKCYTDANTLELKLSPEGKPITRDRGEISKCEWIRNCGSWSGQSMGRFNCSASNKKLTSIFKNT